MPSNDKPDQVDHQSSTKREASANADRVGLAMELPVTFVGAVAVGGFIGYYLDKWLHTAPWLLVVFGCLGFTAGILEIARRFAPKDPGGDDGSHSS